MKRKQQVPRKLERRLASYAMAIAGLGIAAPSAAAQVIYTQTDLKLTNGALNFDFDGNGTPDLNLVNAETNSYYFVGGVFFVTGNAMESNAVLGQSHGRAYLAVAVPEGASIGTNSPAKFLRASKNQAPLMEEAAYSYNAGRVFVGHFGNVTDKYLGFRFSDGAVHYGWMRLTVTADPNRLPAIIVKVSGYAYEATPNQAIIAGDRGHTTAPSHVTQEAGATLGQLSLGWAGRK